MSSKNQRLIKNNHTFRKEETHYVNLTRQDLINLSSKRKLLSSKSIREIKRLLNGGSDTVTSMQNRISRMSEEAVQLKAVGNSLRSKLENLEAKSIDLEKEVAFLNNINSIRNDIIDINNKHIHNLKNINKIKAFGIFSWVNNLFKKQK